MQTKKLPPKLFPHILYPAIRSATSQCLQFLTSISHHHRQDRLLSRAPRSLTASSSLKSKAFTLTPNSLNLLPYEIQPCFKNYWTLPVSTTKSSMRQRCRI